MKNKETGEFELVVGNGQIISGFFILALLLAVFFAMGFIVARAKYQQEPATTTAAASTSPELRQPASTPPQPPAEAKNEPPAQDSAPPAADSAPRRSALPKPKPNPSWNPLPRMPRRAATGRSSRPKIHRARVPCCRA